jgi:hypothetical protein
VGSDLDLRGELFEFWGKKTQVGFFGCFLEVWRSLVVSGGVTRRFID